MPDGHVPARAWAFFAANTDRKAGDWLSATSPFCDPQLYA